MQAVKSTRQEHLIKTPYQAPRLEKIKWLIANNLPPLPVAPAQDPYQYYKVIKASDSKGTHCPLTSDFKPIPIFTGKNPSYLDESGNPI
ncbi:MAG: type VI secretion system baseplate subunit TssK [Hydrococcus sp. RM1_1_31]|nr:type VI secretion system baseplate subunit TssK [Hydrococcus sp. RM1_1_31]